MKCIHVLLALIISCNCYSQVLSNEEQNKVYNTIRSINSYVQPWNTARLTTQADSSKQVRLHCASSTYKAAEPLLIVDGIVKEMSCLKNINPADIKSVNILKDEAALKKYGQKAQNGVIEVELKHPGKTPV